MPVLPISEAYTAWASTLSGMDVWVFLAFLFSLFVTATITIEFYRGAKIRQGKHGGGMLWNTWQLTMKNRRRYGGYIIHFGVVLTFIAFAGAGFKLEAPEQVLYPGDRVDLGEYHLTFADAEDMYVDDGAYVATVIDMVVMKEGEAVPPDGAREVADRLESRGLGPFHVETVRNSPAVRLRFADPAQLEAAREALFVQTFFKERFRIVQAQAGEAVARFQQRDLRVIEVMPPLMHKHAQIVRDFFAHRNDGTDVRFQAGSQQFEIRFPSTEVRDRFVSSFQAEPMFEHIAGARYREELGALDVYMSNVGFSMVPEVRFYKKHETPTTEVAIRSYPLHDLYLAMRPAAGQPFINLMVVVFPLVSFLWTGALIMVLGGVICLLPAAVTVARRFRIGVPAGAASGLLLALLLAGLLGAPGRAAAQAAVDEGHGAATPMSVLPPSDIANLEQAEARLMSSVRCVEHQGAEWIFRGGTLAECRTSYSDGLRAQLLAFMARHRDRGPAEAVHYALMDFLDLDPANERMLVYEQSEHSKMMSTTNCYCGCSDAMSLSQCPLTCENSKEWNTRFKVLLAEGYHPPEIRSVYLASKNEALAPGERAWTFEDLDTDSDKNVTWFVPAVVVGGAGAAFAALMAALKRRRQQAHAHATPSTPRAPRKSALSAEERALLEDELDELD
jgi:hypothetical protein